MPKAKASDNKIRSLDTMLLDSLETIRKSLEASSIEHKVEIGSVLWQLVDRVGDVLDEIKQDMRVVAVTELKGQVGHTTLEGDDLGEATVTIPKASLRVPRGTNLDDLKRVLGSDFGLFFEETLTIKPRTEFEERAMALTNPLHQQILHNSVARVEPTPRVSFKRHKASKRKGD
jgi:hypothetical protein